MVVASVVVVVVVVVVAVEEVVVVAPSPTPVSPGSVELLMAAIDPRHPGIAKTEL